MSTEGERVLWHAVRGSVVLRYVGELGLVLGVATIVPIAGAVVFRELEPGLPYVLLGGLLLGLGWFAHRVPQPPALQRNEALVVVAAAFGLGSLALSVPLAVQGVPWIDAVFEAVSGVTTTGLSTLASMEGRSQTFLLARAWMQWVGGLGFVVLSLALILVPGVATRHLGALSLEPTDMASSMREHARRVLLVYLGLSGLGLIVLLLLGASPFDAVLHTLSGVSTGGFTPRDTSLAALDLPIQCGVLGLSLLGALSLPLYLELRRGRWERFRDDVEVRAILAFITVVAVVLFATSWLESNASRVPFSDLALLSVSAQTGAGFSTVPPAALTDTGKAALVVSMITGGSQGSTAGGMKLLRVLIVLRLIHWIIAQTRLPADAVSHPTLSGERLEAPELLRAMMLMILFVCVLVASWLPFLAYGYAPLDALFEVASATGTVGLSVGLARPELEPLLKGVLCADMLFGRLEVVAFLVVLAPRTWIGRRTS